MRSRPPSWAAPNGRTAGSTARWWSVRNATSDPGLQDDITLQNYSSEAVDCEIELLVDADQADLFDVKGGRPINEAA